MSGRKTISPCWVDQNLLAHRALVNCKGVQDGSASSNARECQRSNSRSLAVTKRDPDFTIQFSRPLRNESPLCVAAYDAKLWHSVRSSRGTLGVSSFHGRFFLRPQFPLTTQPIGKFEHV